MLRTCLKILALVLGVVLVLAIAYVAYYFISYSRIEDHQSLTIDAAASQEPVQVGKEYTITTYNLGFGAYSDDYSFFMDGGTESWAFSESAVRENISGALQEIQTIAPDFAFFQEVDIDGTRSYHVDEDAMVREAFGSMDHVRAINYDSPFLIYPFTQPHGKNRSCIVTLSSHPIAEAERRSLPIDSGLSRVVDLDRCFSVSAVPVENGKTLYLYNVHLSAYSGEPETVPAQLALLAEDIRQRYEGGNYILVGGDFNQDLLTGGSQNYFQTEGEYSWTQPLDVTALPEFCTLVQPTGEVLPTCRLADAPYVPGKSFVITVDGFIVSDNLKVTSLETVDAGFLWSDHNPVQMRFVLE